MKLADGRRPEESEDVGWWYRRCTPTAQFYAEAVACPSCLTQMWSELLDSPAPPERR